MSADPAAQLPHPFAPDAWPPPLAEAAQALWDWHLHLYHPDIDAAPASGFEAWIREEQRRAARGEAVSIVPRAVAEAAQAACREHGLPTEWLGEQVGASVRWLGPIRFDTTAELNAFVQRWAGSHARLLAHLGGATGAWQQKPVDEMARAFFLTGRLVRLPADLAEDRLFIALEDLQQTGARQLELKAGRVSEPVRRLLWKQAVRVRDAYAQGQELAKDLSGWQRRAFNRWWLGGLEVIGEVERRGYDVWSRPVQLSSVRRFRVRLQALVGKHTAGR